jgi:hypothetical protein
LGGKKLECYCGLQLRLWKLQEGRDEEGRVDEPVGVKEENVDVQDGHSAADDVQSLFRGDGCTVFNEIIPELLGTTSRRLSFFSVREREMAVA